MIGAIGAQLGLLAFAAAVFAGLGAGNAFETVLSRAMLAMVGAAFVGQLAAYATRAVIRDHLQRRKVSIDRDHLDRMGVSESAQTGQNTDAGAAEDTAAPVRKAA